MKNRNIFAAVLLLVGASFAQFIGPPNGYPRDTLTDSSLLVAQKLPYSPVLIRSITGAALKSFVRHDVVDTGTMNCDSIQTANGLKIVRVSATNCILSIDSTASGVAYSPGTVKGTLNTGMINATASSGVVASVTQSNANAGYGMYIDASGGASTNYAFDIRNITEDTTYFIVKTQQGQRGNVGIGTFNPAYPLDVTGKGRFTDTLRVGACIGCTVNDSTFNRITTDTILFTRSGPLIWKAGSIPRDTMVYDSTSNYLNESGNHTVSKKLDVFGVLTAHTSATIDGTLDMESGFSSQSTGNMNGNSLSDVAGINPEGSSLTMGGDILFSGGGGGIHNSPSSGNPAYVFIAAGTDSEAINGASTWWRGTENVQCGGCEEDTIPSGHKYFYDLGQNSLVYDYESTNGNELHVLNGDVTWSDPNFVGIYQEYFGYTPTSGSPEWDIDVPEIAIGTERNNGTSDENVDINQDGDGAGTTTIHGHLIGSSGGDVDLQSASLKFSGIAVSTNALVGINNGGEASAIVPFGTGSGIASADTGTFTDTVTGMTTTVTTKVHWRLSGYQATITVDSASGTSNASTLTIQHLLSRIAPLRTRTFTIPGVYAVPISTTVDYNIAQAAITSDGVMSLYYSLAGVGLTTFPTSGFKGFTTFTFTLDLN